MSDKEQVSARLTANGTLVATYADGHTVMTSADAVPLNTMVLVGWSREGITVERLEPETPGRTTREAETGE